jgi:single-stranded DNA-binding protein
MGQRVAFNDIDELAERLKKDSKVYIEGTLTADAWTDRDGKARVNLNVMTWRCVETHRIGRNKRERKSADKPGAAVRRDDDFHNDPIPF